MTLILILVMALVTYLIRISPFILFGKHQKTPLWVTYLGKYLPPAVMSMLIVYSLKDINPLDYIHSLPVFIAILTTGVLHLWKRNNLLSIISGTAVYMLLLQKVFI
ncbi:MAG: branched-chain amino acid transporter AzlD [Firmicutes bacterium HGW-Firmicutes-5]|nr:MAG: branched-chain amino acid transporter AzlD [Firmicutes bacterium HGW-Firmicutes-5]